MKLFRPYRQSKWIALSIIRGELGKKRIPKNRGSFFQPRSPVEDHRDGRRGDGAAG
jgi:hypothetical protein